MGKVLRGYAKGKDGNSILLGRFRLPHSKDKTSPRGTSEEETLTTRRNDLQEGNYSLVRPCPDLAIDSALHQD